MTSINSPEPQAHSLYPWRVFFSVASVQCILTIIFFISGAANGSVASPGGLSTERLGMIGVVGILLVFFVGLLIVSWVNRQWTLRKINQSYHQIRRAPVFAGLVSLLVLILISAVYLFTVAPEIEEPFTAILLQRLSPALVLFAGISLQTLIAAFLMRFETPSARVFRENRLFWIILAFFGIVFLLWDWAVRNTVPGESSITGWNDLGAPVIETQVFLAWLAGMLTWALIALAHHKVQRYQWLRIFKPKIVDLILIVLIWSSALLLWNGTASPPSYFSSAPRAPNHEAYPNSDALLYDMSAQILAIGQGLKFANDIYVRRPMLAIFFTLVHALGGQNSSAIAFWQVFFLALIPVFVFLLGKALANRPVGVMAAILVTLRGANTISLSNLITTSHAKLLMADVPAMLAMVIFIFLSIRWLQTRSINLALLSGGALGAAILIRPELGGAFIATGLISFMVLRERLRRWLTSLLIFSLGIILLLAPWVYRNWTLTGQIFLDSPTFRSELFQERYNTTPPTPTPDAGQGSKNYPPLFTYDSSLSRAGTSLGGNPGAFLLSSVSGFEALAGTNSRNREITENPRSSAEARIGGLAQNTTPWDRVTAIASFVATHYLNSQIQVFLTLPTAIRPLDNLFTLAGHHSPGKYWEDCCTNSSYNFRMPYWRKWYGALPSQAIVPLFMNLALIAWGIQFSWRKQRWIGLFPLTILVSHLLLNALARNSGGRYIMSVDWIGMLYFCVGLTAASFWVANCLMNRNIPAEIEIVASQTDAPRPPASKPFYRTTSFYLLAVCLLAIGGTAPILEAAIPLRYTTQAQEQMLSSLLNSPDLTQEQGQALQDLLVNGKSIFGRALYPRYYPANQGEPAAADPLGPQPYPRLGFYLANQTFQPIVLPFDRQPEFFPSGADAIALVCPDGSAGVIAVFTSPNDPPAVIYFRSGEAAPPGCFHPG